jgi:hypothetical protein
MITKAEQTKLKKALKILQVWTSMTQWSIVLEFKAMDGVMGSTDPQTEYKQAIITINQEARFTKGYEHDTHMNTLCHEFAHIWLWDIHNPELYESNWAYRRLVEGSVEGIGRILYLRVLQPWGY